MPKALFKIVRQAYKHQLLKKVWSIIDEYGRYMNQEDFKAFLKELIAALQQELNGFKN